MKKRSIVALGVAAALAVGLGAAGTAQAANYAGHWKLTLSARCNNTPQNAKVCAYVVGQLGVIGKKGTVLSEAGYDALVVSANGKYTDSGVITLTEAAPGAKTHGCPSASKLSSVEFNGSCVLKETGRGHVANSSAGPVFHSDYEVLTYNNTAPIKDTTPSNSGLPSPAKTGSYSAAWAAHQAGSSSTPAGFSLQYVVTRS